MGDETLQHPIPPEPAALLESQAKTAHFWVFAASTVLGGVLRSGVFGFAPWVHLSVDLLPIAQLVGYQLAALWQPPRAAWTADQRNSYYAAQLRAAGYRVERADA